MPGGRALFSGASTLGPYPFPGPLAPASVQNSKLIKNSTMNSNNIKYSILPQSRLKCRTTRMAAGILFLACFSLTACKKNYLDPSGPSSGQAFNSPNALTDVAVGLQNWYTAGRGGLVYNTITADGLLTNQLYVVNAGNTDEAQLGNGAGAVQNTNGIVTGMWTVANKIIFDADSVINQTPRIVTDKNYASGLIAYTSIFKALAVGDMAMFWDSIPAGVTGKPGGTSVSYIANNDGYLKAIAVIDNALSVVNANAISATFLGNIPKGSIDI